MFGQAINNWFRCRWNFSLVGQNILSIYLFAVNRLIGAVILVQGRSLQLQSRKYSFAARVREDLGRHQSVRFSGTLHDFLMLNPICGTAALKQTIHVLRKAPPGTS